MASINSGGLTIAGGFHISTKALLVLLAGGIIGGYFGQKFIGTRPVQLAFTSKAYNTESNPHNVKGMIISRIARLTKQPGDVLANMDQVVGRITAHEPHIQAIVHKRKIGEIDHAEFDRQLFELAKTIMRELGVNMETGLKAKKHYKFEWR